MPQPNITADPSSWPMRALEKGATSYDDYPRRRLDNVDLDDTDRAIIDAIIGKPNEKDLRLRVMRMRRLSPGQVDGWRARRTAERNRSAPDDAKPRYGALVPEEREELDALLAERAKLARIDEADAALLARIATRRRVRKAKRLGIETRLAELRAKGGIP